MRVTEVTIALGGYVGNHYYLGPGIRQMAASEMECIPPGKNSYLRAGDFFFEAGEVSHWVNKAEEPNTHLLFEILSTGVKGTSLIFPRGKPNQ